MQQLVETTVDGASYRAEQLAEWITMFKPKKVSSLRRKSTCITNACSPPKLLAGINDARAQLGRRQSAGQPPALSRASHTPDHPSPPYRDTESGGKPLLAFRLGQAEILNRLLD